MEAWSNVYCSVLVLVLWRPAWRLHVDAAESPVRTLVCTRNESQALLELEMELLIVNETDELINIGQWHCWTVLANFSICSTSASLPADIASIQQKLLETTTLPSRCEGCGGRIWKEIFARASDKLINEADLIVLLLTQNRSNMFPPPATTGKPPLLSLDTSGQQGTPKVYVAEVQRMSRRSLAGIVNCSWSMGKHKSSVKAAAAGNSPLVGGGTTVQSVRSSSAGAGGGLERGPPGREVNHGEQDNDKLQNLSKTSVIFVCVSFIILMAISLAWLVFYYIQRFRYAHAKDRLARRLFNAAKKALSKIPTKALTRSDGDELDSDCPVCIEPYRPGDMVRVLPCHHVFHKTCVDPWLLEHRTCPMCKGDILKAFGYHFHTGEESSLGGRRPSSAAPRTAGRVASAGGVGAAGGVGGGGGELSDRSSDDGQPSSLPDYPFPSGADSDVPDPFSFSPPNSPTIVQQVLHQGNVQAFTIIPLTVHSDSAAVTRRPASRGQVDLSRQREDVGATSESTCVGRHSTQVQIHHQQVAEEEEEEVKKGISTGKGVDSASSISSSSAGSSAPLVQKDNTADRLASSHTSSSGPFEPNFGDDPFVPTPGAGDDFDARQKSNSKEAASTERAKQQQQKPLSRRSVGVGGVSGGEKRPSTTFHSKTWSSRRRAARNRSPTSRQLTMTMTRTTSSPNRPQTTTTTGQEFGSLESL